MNSTCAIQITRNEMKKRILFCGEASYLNTGYASYYKEVISYLHSTNKYEIAELGSYASVDNKVNIPWRFYPVMPSDKASDEEKTRYNSSMSNQFGEYRFSEACLDFLPDIVCDIRDFWMLEFQERSPYRKYYKWIIMPTVDAAPQASNWMMTYASADACLTYSDWAGDVMKKAGLTNYQGSAPPSSHRGLRPLKNLVRPDILKDKKVIGTVMRNQRRKLYPDLFEAFKKFLQKVEKPEEYVLYCHTSYPDMGWDIPELLLKNGISNRVLFTYMCKETQRWFPHYFAGPEIPSPFKEGASAALTNVRNGVSSEQFAEIYNLFDVYVQYANSEGFGLPQVEAAACAVPVMAVDYSAMSSVVKKLNGIPLKPKAFYKEMETGCMRAVPDNDLTSEELKKFFELSSEKRKEIGDNCYTNFLEHYQWHKTGKVWEDVIDSIDVPSHEKTWFSNPEIIKPDPPLENYNEKSIDTVINHLIFGVLAMPERANSFLYQRLLRDLKYGYSNEASASVYCNDSSLHAGLASIKPFGYEQAYNVCYGLRMEKNQLEQIRARKLLGRNI